RLAWLIVAPSGLTQYTWVVVTATPTGGFWPPTRTRGLLPSRLATLIVPLEPVVPVLVQYRGLASTVPPAGPSSPRPVASAWRLLPSRLARLTEPPTALTQYTWVESTATP